MPIFSIIIPVYNVKQYLSDCIKSVLNQTIRDYEILLIDDGSTDGSEQICDEYAKKSPIIRAFHKENGGLSSARNKGIELARGAFLLFVDSDDYIAPETLEWLKDRIDDNNQVDVILSESMIYVEPDGIITHDSHSYMWNEFDGIDGKDALLMMHLRSADWSACGKCFKTSFWREKEFKFAEGRVSEDFLLIDRVILEAKVVSMIPAHYYYRWKNQTSIMHSNFEKLIGDTLYGIKDWDVYLRTKSIGDELDAAIRKTIAKLYEHTVLANIYYTDKLTRRELIKSAKDFSFFLNFDDTFEGRAISFSIKVIGVKSTCFLLNLLKRKRKASGLLTAAH